MDTRCLQEADREPALLDVFLNMCFHAVLFAPGALMALSSLPSILQVAPCLRGLDSSLPVGTTEACSETRSKSSSGVSSVDFIDSKVMSFFDELICTQCLPRCMSAPAPASL